MRTFGEKIVSIRKQKKISQEKLGSSIGSSKMMIGRYERNETVPSVDIAWKIAKALGVSLDHLVDDSNDSPLKINQLIHEKVSKVESLPEKERELLFYLIDTVFRDVHTKKTYSK